MFAWSRSFKRNYREVAQPTAEQLNNCRRRYASRPLRRHQGGLSYSEGQSCSCRFLSQTDLHDSMTNPLDPTDLRGPLLRRKIGHLAFVGLALQNIDKKHNQLMLTWKIDINLKQLFVAVARCSRCSLIFHATLRTHAVDTI
jgi:hypothetical protein